MPSRDSERLSPEAGAGATLATTGSDGRGEEAASEPRNRSGLASNALAHPSAQNGMLRPPSSRRAAARSGSTVMPQTGSRDSRIPGSVTD